MKIYNYNQDGEYVGQSLADESPLEPGIYLIPAYATIIEPPITDNQHIAVFNGEGWTMKDISLEVPKPEVAKELEKEKTYAELLEEKLIRLENENVSLKGTLDTLVLSLL